MFRYHVLRCLWFSPPQDAADATGSSSCGTNIAAIVIPAVIGPLLLVAIILLSLLLLQNRKKMSLRGEVAAKEGGISPDGVRVEGF